MTLSDRIAALSAPDRAIDATYVAIYGDAPELSEKHTLEWRERLQFSNTLTRLMREGAWMVAALLLVQPSMQAHVMEEALKLVGTRGFTAGKFTEALAIAICVVALRERGL